MAEKCLECGKELPPFEHCTIDKQEEGGYRIAFRKGHEIVSMLKLTEFQWRLMIAALNAGYGG